MQTHEDYRRGIAALSLPGLYSENDRWHRMIDNCPPQFAADCAPAYMERANIVQREINARYSASAAR